MEINKVYQEPCLETLKKMPNDFLDCVITSPPYWQLRDYGYEGQWGLEPTYQEYLEHLWEMMDEIYRVLKPTGTCWINLGDSYMPHNGSRGNKSYSGSDTLRKDKNLIATAPMTTREMGNIKAKSLVLIPHRFAIGCIERGWILRNDIIWAKRNGMPESVTDRFSKKHEYIFFMTKNEKYYFDLDSVRDKVKASSLERYQYAFSGNKNGEERQWMGYNEGDKTHLIPTERKTQYSIIEEKYRNPIVEYRDLPNQDELRNYLSEARKQVGITIQEIENIFNTQSPHHWFEKNGSYPSAEDWIQLKTILKFDEKYDFQMTEIYEKSGLKENHPLGKNCGDVADFWDITTKPNKSSHYATYNDELLRKPILAGCPEGGLIYDPFMGSGTTAEGAIRAKRNFIGSEMSSEYMAICNQRIQSLLSQPTLF